MTAPRALHHSADVIYPDAPGFKVPGPSQEAAEAVKEPARVLREGVLRAFGAHPYGATADEIADALGRSILSVRPRVSELYRQGEIERTGERRRNDSGMSATVWRTRAAPPRNGGAV